MLLRSTCIQHILTPLLPQLFCVELSRFLMAGMKGFNLPLAMALETIVLFTPHPWGSHWRQQQESNLYSLFTGRKV